MKSLKLLLYTMPLFLVAPTLIAQDFTIHKWKHRVLIVKTNSITAPAYLEQLKLLQRDASGWHERKLKVYQIHQNKFKPTLQTTMPWMPIDSTKHISTLKHVTSKFEIILIGLDGQVKLSQKKVLDLPTLFKTIDVMPMRVQELKNK